MTIGSLTRSRRSFLAAGSAGAMLATIGGAAAVASQAPFVDNTKAAMATLEAYAESMGMELKVGFFAKGIQTTDAELIDRHVAELKAALRRVYPDLAEVKRLSSNGVLKFGLLAFT